MSLDDPALRSAMSAYVTAAEALDATAQIGGEPRALLDLAEAKAVAGLALHKQLVALGWTAPAGQRSTT